MLEAICLKCRVRYRWKPPSYPMENACCPVCKENLYLLLDLEVYEFPVVDTHWIEVGVIKRTRKFFQGLHFRGTGQ